MTLRLTGLAKRNTRVLALMACASSLCSLAPAAAAQDPIRVESNQVLIPVYVTNKELDRLLRKDPTNFGHAVREGNAQLQEYIAESTMMRDLTAVDFRVFEDGQEQTIKSVTYEPSLHYIFRDNKGHHGEYFGEGGGKWSTREWPPWLVGGTSPPHYLIAYSPPESPEGSCHQIKVKVNRPNALVGARTEYCNTRHSALDPLRGTVFGKQMESHLASAKDDKVDVSLTAIELYSNSDAARVHIALDWPWNSLKGNSKTVGVFGIVLKKDGTLATRFSDLAGFNSTDEDSSGPHWDHIWTRYEMQLTLTPGEYDLRAVVSDGTRFGLAEIPLTVDSYDTRELAISALSLCKQVSEASAYSSKNQPRLPGTWTAKLPGNYVPLVSNDMEFKPTAHTRFKKGDTLYTYFEVYEPLLKAETPPTVQIQIRVADLKTGEVESDSQPISATPYVKPGSTVIPIGRGIDISKLPTGSYRLDVRATDSAGKTTVWRSANFTVD